MAFPRQRFNVQAKRCSVCVLGCALALSIVGVGATPHPAGVEVAAGALRVFRFQVDPVFTHGLPVNEVRQSQLDSNTPRADGFVPAQLGNFLAISALGNAWRQRDGTFTAGYSDRELITTWQATMTSIENILANHAFLDSITGKKSFYQFHGNDGSVGNDGFSRIVSMLDCNQAIVGMHVAEQYLRSLEPADLDSDVTLVEARLLAERFRAALTQFSHRMWLETNPASVNFGRIYFGAANDPRAGASADRLINEGRLGYVAALAREEITQAEFDFAIEKIRRDTPRGQSPYGGPWVERRAYFGTGLEIYAVAPFLTSELRGPFGDGSLFPYVDAWIATALGIDVPGAGHSNISTGFGFAEFGMSPLENSPHPDQRLVIPPAVGMMAGTTGVAPFSFLQPYGDRALNNLSTVVSYLKANSAWDNTYGAANYKDVSSGLVDDSDRAYGTLEIAEMCLGLLNGFLGGRYLEDLLSHDSGWFNALRQYQAALNVREVEFNASAPDIFRGGASSSRTVRLESNGASTSNQILIGEPGTYDLALHYSNSGVNSGTPEIVEVLVDGNSIGQFTSQDSTDWGVFIQSPWLPVGTITTPRIATVTVRLVGGEFFGVEPDKYSLQRRSLAVNDPPNVTEGDSGQKQVEFMVSLLNVAGGPVTVDYATEDGTAVAGSDYAATSGALSFGPGETTRRVQVAVNGNTAFGPDKSFRLRLSNATGAGLDRAVGEVLILNDDAAAPPVAGPDSFRAVQGAPTTIAAAKLLSNDSDPGGGTLAITAVASPSAQGGTVTLNAGVITYTSPPGFAGDDTFAYTLSNGSATASGAVTVHVAEHAGAGVNIVVPPAINGNGFFQVTFAGIPGFNYAIEWAADLAGPWTEFGTPTSPVTAPANGVFDFVDPTTPAPSTRFYRTRASTP